MVQVLRRPHSVEVVYQQTQLLLLFLQRGLFGSSLGITVLHSWLV